MTEMYMPITFSSTQVANVGSSILFVVDSVHTAHQSSLTAKTPGPESHNDNDSAQNRGVVNDGDTGWQLRPRRNEPH